MTGITRKSLASLDALVLLPPVRDMADALGRILDLRDAATGGSDRVWVDDLDAALTGTQTDDGAEAADSGLPASDPMHGGARTVGAVGNHPSALPAPSSPDRMAAVAEIQRAASAKWEADLRERLAAEVAAIDTGRDSSGRPRWDYRDDVLDALRGGA